MSKATKRQRNEDIGNDPFLLRERVAQLEQELSATKE